MTSSTATIKFRLDKKEKECWKKLCQEKQITLTSLIKDSVENRILDNERREILTFIEKQDNVFVKIQSNINQVARIVNGQKFISDREMQKFSARIAQMAELKQEQNKIFEKIYSILAK